MRHFSVTNRSMHNTANLRAEDGHQTHQRQRALQTAILVPFLIFAFIAILVLLLSHPAFGQAVGGRIAGSVKDETGRSHSRQQRDLDRSGYGSDADGNEQ